MTLRRFRTLGGMIPGLALIAFSMAAAAAYSQEAPAIPEPLQDTALTVTVHTQMDQTPTAPAWEVREVKSTLPGSAVSVKLVGESLVVLVNVTPYQNPEGLLLLVQAQVWVRTQDKIYYHTALSTLRVGFGEPVVFYPLGDDKGKAALRVLIIVNPYRKDALNESPGAAVSENP